MVGFVAGVQVNVGSARSQFVCTAPQGRAMPVKRTEAKWTMAKVSKFGPFSPVVVAARVVIGEKEFNKIRGKGIALHSQVITGFCTYVGTSPKMRTGLIGMAKENGNTLGFLS